MLDIESPKGTGDVDEYTICGDVQARTNSSPTTESEMITGVNVRNCGVFRSAEWVIYEAIRVELAVSKSKTIALEGEEQDRRI
jgi:hypothetical protein